MGMRQGVLVFLICAGLAVVFYGVVLAGGLFNRPAQPDTVVCTADAMQCPDGSYVGRTGPECKFVCPQTSSSTTPVPTSATVATTIGKSVHALNVDILPLEVTQDSRCPVDVECIWAGTVEVKGTLHSGLGTSNVVFKLGTSITTEAESVTLVSVQPVPHQGITIAPAEYKFIFEVKKR